MDSERNIHVVPQEFCPQAVIDWCNFDEKDENRRSDLDRAKVVAGAKSHLSAVGWTLWYGRKYDRQELRYTSPSGKVHYSLRSACKACVEDGAAAGDDQNRLVPVKVEAFSREIAASPRNATPNGKSPAEQSSSCSSCNSDSNSATSPSLPRRSLRKRKLDFESENPEAPQQFNDKINCDWHNVDLKDETLIESNAVDITQIDHSSEKPSCSSEAKPGKATLADSTEATELELSSEKPGCSSEPNKPVSKPGKVMADLKRSMEIKGRKGLKKRSGGAGDQSSNKRVRKIPNTSRPRQNPRLGLGTMIDSGVVNPGDRVSYRGKPSSGGVITRDGIQCNCCSVVFALTAFEEHVGSTNHRPAANIVLEDGRSLTDCKNQMQPGGNCGGGDRTRKVVSAKKKGRNVVAKSSSSADESDDICSFCQYGGELVLCDRCPSAYHPSCLGLEAVPDGDWFCPSCCCGVCGNGKLEGGCGGVGNSGDIMVCLQCERKFHQGCLRREGFGSDQGLFCSRRCEDVCLGLRALVGKPTWVGEDGLTWTLLKSGENDPRLKAALAVMHQCFEPAKDPLTQRDVVRDVVSGRKSGLSRLNFTGFYVAVLEREAEMISVATVRVYGRKLAEVPLVATSFDHRRLGMCRVLMAELERRLLDLGVERLTLPAAPSVLQTWTHSFGFSKMSFADKLEFLPYNLLDFQDTSMCHKLLVKKAIIEEAQPSLVFEDLPAVATDNYVNGYCSFPEAESSAVSAERFRDCGFMEKGIVPDVAAKVGV